MDDGERRAESNAALERLVNRVIWAGWGCLAVSAVSLFVSGPITPGTGDDNVWAGAMALMLARMAGIGAFAIGGVAIFNRRWLSGIVLFLSAVVLPYLSYLMHGTI